MTSFEVKTNCTRCKFDIKQDINKDSQENYIYCPSCDNIFVYIPDTTSQEPSDEDLVSENLEKAYMEIPHTFIRTEAIFIKGHINGHELNFLLDTGAEMSVIPADIIQACGLEKILDKHFSGVMKGVGEAKMLGKIHYIEVVLECGVYPCSFSVCSNNDLPPILGIDMMYNLGISLDFKSKKIHFDNGCSVDFITRSHALTSK